MRTFRRLIAGSLAVAAILSTALTPLSAVAGSVKADASSAITGRYTGVTGLGSVTFTLDQAALTQFAPGTGPGQADLLFADHRTLAASATENLDLAGVLADPFGAILTFGHVKAIYIKAKSTNTNAVVVGGAATNGFVGPLGGTTPTISLAPGGSVMLTHAGLGWTVTPSTGDLLKIANSASGTSVQYDVVIIGTST